MTWSDWSFKLMCEPISCLVFGLFYSGVWLGLELRWHEWEKSIWEHQYHCWTIDVDLFCKTLLWNIAVTEFIDTCHLIGRHFKRCVLIMDKGPRKVPAGSSEVGSTGTGIDPAGTTGSCKKAWWGQCGGTRWGWRRCHHTQVASRKRQSELVGIREVWSDCVWLCSDRIVWRHWVS